MYADKNTDDGNKNNLCLFVTLWTQGCPNKTVSSLPPTNSTDPKYFVISLSNIN